MANSAKTSLAQLFQYSIENKLPLAFYRLPASDNIKVVAQTNSVLQKILPGKDQRYQKGFLFAPFREDDRFSKVLIRPDIFTTEEKLPDLNFANGKRQSKTAKPEKPKLKTASEKNYKNLVKLITLQIQKGEFQKIAAARLEKRRKPEDFEPVAFFKALCLKYHFAFVSLVYTPFYGLWIGASPEILLNVNSGGFKTYALAGTQGVINNPAKASWDNKQKEEQKIVSQYILQSFKGITPDSPVITGPETVMAGNLLHLRTTFVYPDIPHSLWPKVIEQLHPTPAVAGWPKQKAIDFILENEKAPRGFYSGYLGPVNLDREIYLFVNLRCMQVLKNKVAVYVGCGITGDSKPSEEWEESKLKAETLFSVLERHDKNSG